MCVCVRAREKEYGSGYIFSYISIRLTQNQLLTQVNWVSFKDLTGSMPWFMNWQYPVEQRKKSSEELSQQDIFIGRRGGALQ